MLNSTHAHENVRNVNFVSIGNSICWFVEINESQSFITGKWKEVERKGRSEQKKCKTEWDRVNTARKLMSICLHVPHSGTFIPNCCRKNLFWLGQIEQFRLYQFDFVFVF